MEGKKAKAHELGVGQVGRGGGGPRTDVMWPHRYFDVIWYFSFSLPLPCCSLEDLGFFHHVTEHGPKPVIKIKS